MNRLVLFFLLAANILHAQHFVAEASVTTVPDDGFYKLQLAPAWVPYLNNDLSNIRIFDSENKEVPYLYQQEAPVSFTQQFRPYKILEKKQKKNCCTSILLHNPDGRPINNISLTIKNAEVTKHATLLGSDDNQNWYALKEHFILSAINNTDNTTEVKIVDFPLSNYTYYQIQVEDSTSAPLNILNAGYYEVNTSNGSYTTLKTQFHQTDSALLKSTFVYLKLNQQQLIDKLVLSAGGPPYFLRRASLHQKLSQINKNGETLYYYAKLDDFTISSKQHTVLDLSGVRADEILIIIQNDDNPALTIKQLNAYQLNRYFTAWLSKDARYTIKIGEPTMPAPVYDLAFFKESIASTIPSVVSDNLKLLPTEKAPASPSIFTNRNIIWVAIVLVIIVFGALALKMARETTAGNENSN